MFQRRFYRKYNNKKRRPLVVNNNILHVCVCLCYVCGWYWIECKSRKNDNKVLFLYTSQTESDHDIVKHVVYLNARVWFLGERDIHTVTHTNPCVVHVLRMENPYITSTLLTIHFPYKGVVLDFALCNVHWWSSITFWRRKACFSLLTGSKYGSFLLCTMYAKI